jgi:LPXTG-motif cell wall-anchored protein
MDIEFVCEHCGRTLKVQDYLAGQATQCYHCKAPVVIPQEDEVAIIEFQCLGCGTQFRVPSSRAGTRTKCPKCEAVVAVPGVDGRMVAPPPVVPRETPVPEPQPAPVEEPLPPPPPIAPPQAMQRRRGGAGLPRGGQASAEEGSDEEYLTPPKTGVQPVWIFLWVGVAVLLIIGIWMVAGNVRPTDQTGIGEKLLARIQYDQPLDAFVITNQSQEMWRDVNLTIETPEKTSYTYHMDILRPMEPVTVEGKQFLSKTGAAFDGTTMKGERVVVTAQLPSGTRGTFVLKWGGGGQ